MNFGKLVLGFSVVMTVMSAVQAQTVQMERVKLETQFINEQGQAKNGQLDLAVQRYSDTLIIRDITAQNGDRFPIALRTGFAGASYMFAKDASNTQLLCSSFGYAYGAVSSITASVPRASKLSSALLVVDNSGKLVAGADDQQPSLSIVKCCKSLPCDNDGE